MVNEMVAVQELHFERSIVYTPIPRAYIKVAALQLAFFLVLVTAALFGLYQLEAYTFIAFIGVSMAMLLLLILRLALLVWSFRYRGYCVRTYDILYRQGILNIEETIVPYNRVQHVKLRQGMWSKLFGLSDLILFTAAGNNFNLQIAGLPKDVAEQIKSFIIAKIGNPEIAPFNEASHEEELPRSETSDAAHANEPIIPNSINDDEA